MKVSLSLLLIFTFCRIANAQEKVTFQLLENILSDQVKTKDLNTYLLQVGYVYRNSIPQPSGNVLYYIHRDSIGVEKHNVFTVTIKDGKKTSIDYTTLSFNQFENILKEIKTDKIDDNYLSRFRQTNQGMGNGFENGDYDVSVMCMKSQYGMQYSVGIAFKSGLYKTHN